MEDSAPKKKFEKPQTLISWRAPSRLHVPRQKKWFMGLVVLVSVIVGLLLLVREWSLALFFAAFGFIIFALSMVEPEEVLYEITTEGFKFEGKQFSWKDLDHFFITFYGGENVLLLKTKLIFPEHLEIILKDQSEKEVEEELLKHIPYREIKHSSLTAFLDGMITGVSRRIPESRVRAVSSPVNQIKRSVEGEEETKQKRNHP